MGIPITQRINYRAWLEGNMKKQDLLNLLATKYYKVGTVSEIIDAVKTAEGVKWYVVGAYEKGIDTLIRNSVHFYVENEGLTNEVAYWMNGEPKPTTVENLNTKLENYLITKIADGTIAAGYIRDVNDKQETALIDVVVIVSNNLVKKTILIDKDTQGKLRQRIVG